MKKFEELQELCKDLTVSGLQGIQVISNNPQDTEFKADICLGEIAITVIFDGSRKDFVEKLEYAVNSIELNKLAYNLFTEHPEMSAENCMMVAIQNVEELKEVVCTLNEKQPNIFDRSYRISIA